MLSVEEPLISIEFIITAKKRILGEKIITDFLSLIVHFELRLCNSKTTISLCFYMKQKLDTWLHIRNHQCNNSMPKNAYNYRFQNSCKIIFDIMLIQKAKLQICKMSNSKKMLESWDKMWIYTYYKINWRKIITLFNQLQIC